MVRNNNHPLRNNPEKRISHLLCAVSLKSGTERHFPSLLLTKQIAFMKP
jgi:hypothetical protein